MKTTAEILRDARKKVEKPEAWTKGRFSADEYGDFVQPTSEFAICFCVNGAIISAGSDNERSLIHSRAGFIMSQCARRRGYETASKLNDAPETTHADVLSLFDDAIAWAESEA